MPNTFESPSNSSSSLKRIQPLTRGLVETPGVPGDVQNGPDAASDMRNSIPVNRAIEDHSQSCSLIDELRSFISSANEKVEPMKDTYSGQTVSGIPHGMGKMKYRNEQGEVVFEFEGHFNYGIPNGHGKETYPNGSSREVEYRNSERYSGGKATIFLSNHVFTGSLSKTGRFYSDISITYPQSDPREFYIGQLNADLQPYGKGTLNYRNGNSFKGNFFNGQPSGRGTGKVTLPQGVIYSGPLNDKLEPLRMAAVQPSKERETNPVSLVTTNKRKRDWEKLKEHLSEPRFKTARLSDSEIPPQPLLQNKRTYKDGRVYEGQLMNYLPQGVGRMRYPDDTIFEGMFEKGMRSGFGRILFPNGMRHVTYEQDQIVSGGFARLTHKECQYSGPMSPEAQFVGETTILYPKEDAREWYCGSLNSDLEPSGQGKMKYRNGDIFEGTLDLFRNSLCQLQVVDPCN